MEIRINADSLAVLAGFVEGDLETHINACVRENLERPKPFYKEIYPINKRDVLAHEIGDNIGKYRVIFYGNTTWELYDYVVEHRERKTLEEWNRNEIPPQDLAFIGAIAGIRQKNAYLIETFGDEPPRKTHFCRDDIICNGRDVLTNSPVFLLNLDTISERIKHA